MIPAVVIVAAIVLIILGPLNLVLALVLRRDLNDLRRRMDALPRGARASAAQPDAEPHPGPAAAAPGAAPVSRLPAPGPLPARRDLETALGGQWLTWLGILAIFFGTAFFLAYDLGGHPLAGVGQLMVGLLVGALFIVAGRTIVSRLGRFLARGLLGGGVALLFLTAYASYAFHHLVPAVVVYPFLLGVAVIGAAIALVENAQSVAVLTAACVLVTPFFLTGRSDPAGPLLAYLVFANLGSAFLAARRRWRLVPLVAFGGTVVLVAWWWARAYSIDERAAVALGTTALWLLFGAPPLFRRGPDASWGAARAVVLAANGLLYETVLYHLLAPEFTPIRGVANALLALAYVAASGWSETVSRRHGAPPAHAAVVSRHTGLALAALAVPTQFDLAWVTLGWALLALVMLAAGFRGTLGERLIGWLVLLLALVRAFVIDVLVQMREASTAHPHHVFANGSFLVAVATTGSLGFAAHLVWRHRQRLGAIERRLVTPLVLLAAVLLVWRLSFELAAWYRLRESLTGDDAGRPFLLALSLLWAVYAGLLIAAGFIRRWRPIRVLGIAILVVLLGKVFLFDIQALERGYRIASFVGVGLLLLGISILYQRERRTR